KSNPKMQHVPVLLLIGAMEPYDPDEGRKVRADGVLTKPLKSTELATTVKQLLAAAPKPSPPPPKAKAAAPQPSSAETHEAALETEELILEETLEVATAGTGYPKKMEIAEEMREQPLTAYGDLLESPEPAPEPATATEEFLVMESAVAEERPSVEPARLEQPGVAVGWEQAGMEAEPGPVVEQAQSPSATPWEIQTGETLQELVPKASAPEPAVQWRAESVPVTSQDEGLFEPPKPDWGSLTQMVSTEAEAPPAEPAAAAMQSQPFQAPALYSTPAEEMEAAASPVAGPAPLDPARLEQIVRQTLEDLMPEIVRRVAQAVRFATPEDSESHAP
ncbi:MAG: hypothetical protein HY647_01010, partial [Acidobacteria bacterium]|nr:hypothetical protein [Acidobacteriota bacterium]